MANVTLFIIGLFIFTSYLFFLLRMISKQHLIQKKKDSEKPIIREDVSASQNILLTQTQKMEELKTLVQLSVAISVAYVWIFRFHNVIREFNEFKLSDLTRNFVGASKISLATLIVVGIWHSSLIFIPSILMGLFMIAAQYFHFKVKNPFIKHLPSLILLSLCAFLAIVSIP